MLAERNKSKWMLKKDNFMACFIILSPRQEAGVVFDREGQPHRLHKTAQIGVPTDGQSPHEDIRSVPTATTSLCREAFPGEPHSVQCQPRVDPKRNAGTQ